MRTERFSFLCLNIQQGTSFEATNDLCEAFSLLDICSGQTRNILHVQSTSFFPLYLPYSVADKQEFTDDVVFIDVLCSNVRISFRF